MFHPVRSGIPDLLDKLKEEFENLAQDVTVYKRLSEDYEQRLRTELTERDKFMKTFYALEGNHKQMKQQYEEEIRHLRRQCESKGISVAPSIDTTNNSTQRNSQDNTNNNNNINSSASNNSSSASNNNINNTSNSTSSNINKQKPKSSTTQPAIPSSGMFPYMGTQRSPYPVGSKRPIMDVSDHTNSSMHPTKQHKKMPLPDNQGPYSPSKSMHKSNIPNAHDQPKQPDLPTDMPPLEMPDPVEENDINNNTNNNNNNDKSKQPERNNEQPPHSQIQKQQMQMQQMQQQMHHMQQMQMRKLHYINKQPNINNTNNNNSNSGNSNSSSNKKDFPPMHNTMNKTLLNVKPNGDVNGIATNGMGVPVPLPSKSKEMFDMRSRDPMQIANLRTGPPPTNKEAPTTTNTSDTDWIVGYNPNVQTNLDIELAYTLDHDSVVCCVNFSKDGKYLATGSNKKTQIFDVDTGKTAYTFKYDAEGRDFLYIRSICFHPDNNLIACGDEDKTVKIWDIETEKVRNTFKGHELDIYSLDFSNDGRFIASGSGDKKVKIWDVETNKCLYTLGNDEVGPKDGVTSVAISPDGRLVAAGSLDYIVRLWDAQTGYFLERYEGHTESVHSVAFSPDGKSLASGSLDKTLKLWDLSGSRSRSRCRSTFNGHQDFVLSVAFSPDGNWLISGSKDRGVHFWDPRSAVTHLMLQGHKNSVISVAVSPSSGTFATGSGDFRARCWKYKSSFHS